MSEAAQHEPVLVALQAFGKQSGIVVDELEEVLGVSLDRGEARIARFLLISGDDRLPRKPHELRIRVDHHGYRLALRHLEQLFDAGKCLARNAVDRHRHHAIGGDRNSLIVHQDDF